MADTRIAAWRLNPTGHTTFWNLIQSLYPRLYASLTAGRTVMLRSADWTTLATTDNFAAGEGAPTAAMEQAAPDSCEWASRQTGACTDFPTLH